MDSKVLIIDPVHPNIFKELETLNYAVKYLPDIKREEILSIIHQYQGLIIRSKTPIDTPIIQAATRLQWIGRAGSGVDQMDLELLNKRNIPVFTAAEGNKDALAEHTLGMLLALLHHIPSANHQVKARIWNREANRGKELMDMKVGILGYGNMGSAFAKRLQGMQCEVWVYDRYKKGFSNEYIREVSLEKLFECDILSIHVPLTTQTRHWINAEFIEKFTKPFYLINTARGEIVPLKDIVEALESGKIVGAVLDVLENEQFSTYTATENQYFDRLIQQNVILTPHIAGWSQESLIKINETLIRKIREWKNRECSV